VRDKITSSKVIFFLCTSFVLGIFFAPSFILLGLFLLFSFYFFYKKFLFLVCCILFFLLGANHFHYTIHNIPKEIEGPLYVKVSEMPITRGNFERVIVQHGKGKVLLYVDRFSDFQYGETLRISGNFQIPEEEDYLNYLRKEKIYHIVFRPKIERVGKDSNPFYENIFSLRENFRNNIRMAIPFPEVLLLEAVLLGERSSFPDGFNEKLSITGTRHITAISGMHIVIISALLFYLLIFFKIKRKWAALISLLLIIIFIFFVGAPVSAIRAGIMGGVVLLSYFFYRKTDSLRLLVFAATVMLIFNPLLLHYDLGFQLSFLAVAGILFLYTPIKSFLTKEEAKSVFLLKIRLFLKKNEKIADIISVTSAAQIFVFPIILYNFGHFSLYSVFANLLIVPLLPFIMVLGFFTALTGFIIFSFPTYVLLSFVFFIIDTFYVLPFSAIHIKNFPVFLILLFYLLIFYKISRKS
jgi:competence protein ComEC